MSLENEQTIKTYEKYGQNYIDDAINNPFRTKKQADLAKTLATVVEGLPKDAKIFEIGSGYGRDAEILKELGYTNIKVSEVTELFLNYLREHGFEPVKFDATKDDFSNQYDFIMCNAVLVHFPKDEAKHVIQKIFNALVDGGRAYFSVKESDKPEGSDDRIGGERYFSYWTFQEIKDFIEKVGYKIANIEQVPGSRENWINISVRKDQ